MSRRFYCLQTTSVASQPNGLLWNRWRSISGDGADYVSTRPATEWSLYVTFTLLELFFVIVSLIISTQTSIYWNDWFCWLLFWLKKKKKKGFMGSVSTTFTFWGCSLSWRFFTEPSRAAGCPGRLARTGRAVRLCCVVFCLPPRLWVTIHTLSQVHLRGRVRTSSLATLHHRLKAGQQISAYHPLNSDGYSHTVD